MITFQEQQQPLLRHASVASALNLSPQSVKKLEACGAIDRRYTTIGRLLEKPEVSSALTDDGHPVPVLRLGSPSVDRYDADEPGRKTGYHADMTDEELAASALRWWAPQSGGNLPIQAGVMIISAGPLFVAAAEIFEGGHRRNPEDGRIAYNGRLIARGDGIGEPRILAEDSPHIELATAVLSARSPLRGGPVIMNLPTPSEEVSA